MNKKRIMIIAALIVSLAVMSVAVVHDTEYSSAADTVATNVTDGNGYVFTVYDDYTATLTGAGTLTGDVTLPKTVTYNGEDYTLTKIGAGSLRAKTFTTLTIPNTVTEILSGTSTSTGAVSACTSLTAVIFEASSQLEIIGNYAFYGCTALITIVLPDSVTAIGTYAFFLCSSLTTTVLPDSVTTIGTNAFYNCSKLVTVNFPSSLNNIGNSAFNGCAALQSIDTTTASNDLTYGTNVFQGCAGLTSVKLKGNVSASNYMFNGCTNLQSADLSGVTSATMGTYFFQNCSALANVILPPNPTAISNSMFSNCSSLESFAIPSSVTSMGDSAFSGCTSLISLSIPAGVTSIGTNAFQNCTLSITVEDGNMNYTSADGILYDKNETTVIYAGGASGDLVLPETVTSISAYAFANSGIEAITLGSAIISIGNYAFAGSALQSIDTTTASDSITYGSYVFDGCTGLTCAVIKGNVSTYMFRNCTSLQSADLSGVTPATMGTNFFQNCNALTGVILPLGLASIPNYMFSGCESLETIDIGGVSSIGGYAFQNCSSLLEVDLSEVSSIDGYAFAYCTSLSDVTFSQKVDIGTYAFRNTGLTNVYINGGSIGNYAFIYCGDLVTIVFGPEVMNVNLGALTYCTSLEMVWFGKGIVSLGRNGSQISGGSVFGQAAGTSYALVDINLRTIFFECEDTTQIINGSAGMDARALWGIDPGVVIYVPLDYDQDVSRLTNNEQPLNWGKFITLDDGTVVAISGSGFDMTVGDTTNGIQLFFAVTDPLFDPDSLTVMVGGADWTLTELSSGSYVLEIAGETAEITYVTVSVEHPLCNVSFEGDHFTAKDIVSNKRVGSNYVFEIVVDPLYDGSGTTVDMNSTPITPYSGSRYVVALTGDTVITVSGIVPISSFDVTFSVSGSTSNVSVTPGEPIISTDIPSVGPKDGKSFDGWFTDPELINRFDLGTPVTSDITLYAGWVTYRYTVTIFTEYGTVTAATPSGINVPSGTPVPEGTVLYLKANTDYGYQVIGWNVNGNITKVESETFTMTVTEDADVTTNLRYYDSYQVSGNTYIKNTGIITPYDDYEKYWFWGNESDEVYQTMTNKPGNTWILDEFVYGLTNGTLYKVSIYDGTVFASMGVPGSGSSYIPAALYANGLFFVSGKAYDIDFNYVTDVPSGFQTVDYVDGAYYAYYDDYGQPYKYTFVKFTVDKANGTSDTAWTSVYSMSNRYGTVTAYGDGYLFFIEAGTSSSDRKITSLSMSTGEWIDTVTLSGIATHLLDNGFLSYYDGHVYLPTYTTGLFLRPGPITGQIVKAEVLPDGTFERNTVSYTPTGNSKDVSAFIVYNGRGYINAYDILSVFDVDTMTLIYSIPSGQWTHGGMVLDTGHATAENDYTVFLYVIPYDQNTQQIVVFEDKQGQTEGTFMTLDNVGFPQWASSMIMSGPNGEILFWNDGGPVYIYGRHIEDKEYHFFVGDGTTANWITSLGETLEEALLKIPGMTVSSISGTVSYNGTQMNTGFLSNVNYAAIGWLAGDVLDQGTAYHRYWTITADLNTSWYCQIGGVTYTEKDAIADPYVYAMTFVPVGTTYIPVTGVTLDSTMSIEVGVTQKLTPTISPSNATSTGVTWSSSDDTVAAVDRDGSVTGVSEGTATITVTTADGGFTAECVITVVAATSPTVPVTGVALNYATMSISTGGTQKLNAIVSPSDATDKSVSWTSSNNSVATVDANGNVTGKAVGTATVTVTTNDGGYTASCTVTVSAPATGGSISFGSSSIKVINGYTASLPINVGSYTADQIGYRTNNSGVAVVDGLSVKNGVSRDEFIIRGVGVGTTTLTMYVKADESINATCTITVENYVGTPCDTYYFFIKFSEGSTTGATGLTDAEAKAGFWTVGHGSSAAAALSDTCTANGWQLNFDNTYYDGWIDKFMGLGTITRANGDYTYWAQYSWNGSAWAYNQYALGYLATTDYQYIALVYSTTGASHTGTVNLGVTPSDIPPELKGGGTTEYTVTYNTNGGSAAQSTAKVSAGGSADLTKTAGTKTGYTFLGWALSSSASAPLSSYAVNSNVTLYAVWKADSPGTTTPSGPDVPVTGVSVDKTTAAVTAGGTVQINATVSPSNATNKSVTWSSSNISVATVSGNGMVTAVKAGTAVITVKTNDGGYTATCAMTVNAASEIPVTPGMTDNDEGTTATVTEDQMNGAVEQAKNAGSGTMPVLNIDAKGGSRSRTVVSMPASGLKEFAAAGGEVRMTTSSGTVFLDNAAAKTAAGNGDGTVEITVEFIDASELNSVQKEKVGDGLVVSVTLTVGGTPVTELNGSATVTIPYELKQGQDPSKLVVWYLDNSGNVTEYPCTYDPVNKTVTFVTDHFSYYVVVYTGTEGGGAGAGSNALLYTAVILILIIAIVIAAFVYGRSKKSSGA